MSKKINIIEINGKRYNAHTGAELDHGHQRVVKPIVVHEHREEHHQEHREHEHEPRHRTAHQPAKPIAHHKQQHSTTLMRRAVHRPPVSLKRRTKAQGHAGSSAEQTPTTLSSPLFGAPDSRRLERANHIKRSQLITHFNPHQSQYRSAFAVPVTVKRPAAKPAAAPAPVPKPVPRTPAPDIDDIFDRAIQNATSHLEPAPKKAKKHRLHLSRKHARV